MIRALVVDDEPRARSRLRRLLGAHADVEVVGEAGTGDEAVTAALTLRPDVVFLDIRMPGGDGVSVGQRLKDYLPDAMRPLVVFTTAYSDRAVEAFALEATDYLLKPIERERLADALRRVRRACWSRRPAAAAEQVEVEHLEAHRGRHIVKVAITDLAAVTVEDTVSIGHTATGRVRLSGSLQQIEARLPRRRFVRVSRSALVAVAWIEALRPEGSGTFTAVLRQPPGLEVAVSRRRARQLRELLGS